MLAGERSEVCNTGPSLALYNVYMLCSVALSRRPMEYTLKECNHKYIITFTGALSILFFFNVHQGQERCEFYMEIFVSFVLKALAELWIIWYDTPGMIFLLKPCTQDLCSGNPFVVQVYILFPITAAQWDHEFDAHIGI